MFNKSNQQQMIVAIYYIANLTVDIVEKLIDFL